MFISLFSGLSNCQLVKSLVFLVDSVLIEMH